MIPSITTERAFFGVGGELPQPLGPDDGVMVALSTGAKPEPPWENAGSWHPAELILDEFNPFWHRAQATPGVGGPGINWFFARRVGDWLNDLGIVPNDYQAWCAIRIGDEWISRRLEMTLEVY